MKKIFSLIVLSVILSLCGVISEASASEIQSNALIDNKNDINIIEKEDTLLINSDSLISPSCIACISGQWNLTTLSTGKEFRLEKYLIDAWTKAQYYNWSESTTTTLSFSAGLTFDVTEKIKNTYNLQSSRTKTYGVTVNIPADSTKWSKLGLFGDFNRRYVKAEYVRLNSILDTQLGYSYEPTNDQYIMVVYQ